jgi:hypothetical protein
MYFLPFSLSISLSLSLDLTYVFWHVIPLREVGQHLPDIFVSHPHASTIVHVSHAELTHVKPQTVDLNFVSLTKETKNNLHDAILLNPIYFVVLALQEYDLKAMDIDSDPEKNITGQTL